MIGIYKITNNINGKVYIGQSKNIEKRWITHRIKQNGAPLIKNALKKYGIENFTFEIIEECLLEELNKKEIYWINKLSSTDRNIGYNLTSGGIGGDTSKFIDYKSEEHKNALSIAMKKRRLTKEHKEKIKKTILETGCLKGENNGMYNKTHTLEVRQILSETHKGEKNSQFGKHWYTNGEINIVAKECPKGFYEGRTYKTKDNIDK